MNEFQENVVPKEPTSMEAFFQQVKTQYDMPIDDVSVIDYFTDPSKDPVPVSGMVVALLPEQGMLPHISVGGSFSRWRENVLALVSLANQKGIQTLDALALQNHELLHNTTVVSVGGVWGEIFSYLGARCISIDPLMHLMEESDGMNGSFRLKPIPKGARVERITKPLTAETLPELQNHIGRVDIVISSGQLEEQSGLVGSGTRSEFPSEFAKSLIQLCSDGGSIVIKGEADTIEQAVMNNLSSFPGITQNFDYAEGTPSYRTRYVVLSK